MILSHKTSQSLSAFDQFKCLLQLQKLQAHIDDLYKGAFTHDPSSNGESQAKPEAITGLTEEAFGSLGRTQPQVNSRHCIFLNLA